MAQNLKFLPNMQTGHEGNACMIGLMRTSAGTIWTNIGLICGLMAAAAQPLAASVRSPDPAAQMITDPRTGLAMFGYDPVAFHSEGQALVGKAQFTLTVGDTEWRFINAANRAVFAADSQGYIPLFGGHDGLRVSQNRMVKGDPSIFVIAGGRTVFFRTTEDRDTFAGDETMRRKAVELWPQVASQFAGH
jgi:hypothetical protein